MRRGFRAVRLWLEGSFLAPAELFAEVGKRLVFTVGGAAGPLYGTAFRRLGTALMGLETVGSGDFARAMAAALAGIQELGAAEEGDKTMVDAFAPALRALTARLETGRDLRSALGEAAAAAEAGMEATIPLRALKGRASYLGERSEGHQDPGATSTALLFRALADVAGA
jgi:dihydroxyacetone kinase-like protein